MIEAIAMRDRKKALEIYMELCALRTAPQVILTLMRRQFEQLIKIRELSGKAADSEIARLVGLPPFVVTKKYKPALKMYTSEALLSALEECVAADHESKSGRIDAGIRLRRTRHRQDHAHQQQRSHHPDPPDQRGRQEDERQVRDQGRLPGG